MKRILLLLALTSSLFAAEPVPTEKTPETPKPTVESLATEVATLKAQVADLQRVAAVLRQQRDAVTQQLNDTLAQAEITKQAVRDAGQTAKP